MAQHFVTAFLLSGLAALSACQSNSGAASGSGALGIMTHISDTARSCWFRSKAPEFRPYKLANELDAYTGPPRLLLVPAGHPEALPLLVIQAQGTPAKLQAFGPIMNQPLGKRIGADLQRRDGWFFLLCGAPRRC
jgi:hypothetical protein